MKEYLCSTSFLDYDNPDIQQLSLRLQSLSASPREQVKAAFYFVRDEIYYNPYVSFERPEDYQASRVLKQKQGFCIPKAALCAALLRSMGYPTKLYFADIINHKAPQKIRRLMGNFFACHCYIGVYLESRWLKLAPTFNKEMFAAIEVQANDFDGHDNALLPATAADGSRFVEYVNDRGERDDIPYAEIMDIFQEVYNQNILDQWRGLRNDLSEP